MISKEKLLAAPLKAIEEIITEDPSILNKLDEVSDYFCQNLSDSIWKIPSINDVNLDEVKPFSLVRFRGMVQDMFDPEYYLGKYECFKKSNNESEIRLGVFTDCVLDNGVRINHDSQNNVTLERQTFNCVPIPGENLWVKDLFKKSSLNKNLNNSSENGTAVMQSSKRRLSADEEELIEAERNESENIVDPQLSKKVVSHEFQSNPLEQEKGGNAVLSDKLSFHKQFIPIPHDKEPCCFVKIYSGNHNFKLNDVAEFICVLPVDPDLASNGNLQSEESMINPFSNFKEEEAHCPPPSLVPRLHCIFYKKLDTPSEIEKIAYENVKQELSTVRNDLSHLLTKMFGGDALAAEYFILYLVSKIYGRVGTLCLGKLSLNVTGIPENDSFIMSVYNFMSLITQRSVFLPLSLENLNEKLFVPKKDFELNRLVSGMLQLSEGTHLVIDETKMEAGQLNTAGVQNLTSIGNVIQWQKLDYDFQFSKVEIETNINVLILSPAKSILTCDFLIPLNPIEPLGTVDLSKIESKLLEKFRLYMSIVSNIQYALTEEVQKALEEDFVQARKDNPTENNADTFHQLLVTARYMAMSYGQETLSSSLWCKVKEMDKQRKARIVKK